MKPAAKTISHLESRLAVLLHTGTWVACALIGLGLPLVLFFSRDSSHPTTLADGLMKAGIAVFILLPILRVIVMLLLFARRRDYRFAAIAGLVLLIILVSALIGVFSSAASR